MENPYHKAEIKPHHLDREACRIKCFDVFNILSASVALADQYEMAEDDAPVEPTAMFSLHHRLAEPRLSQLLLDIAVFVRTFDDVMSDAAPSAYKLFATKTDGADFIGVLDDGDMRLRDACNKIIHATDFRPVYERVDREIAGKVPQRVWHLDGHIELAGALGKKEWRATLFVENFLETVLERLEFILPDTPASSDNGDVSG